MQPEGIGIYLFHTNEGAVKEPPAPPAEEPNLSHLLADHAAPSAECTCAIQIRVPSGAIKVASVLKKKIYHRF